MLTQETDIVSYLSEKASLLKIKEGEDGSAWFGDHFDLFWELKSGGWIRVQFFNRTERDVTGLSVRFTLVESQCTSEVKVDIWENLSLDFYLPNGTYEFRFFEPQL